MDETLKPCPFCGTPAEAQTYPGVVRVGCVALECTVAPEVDGATLAIAAALWNTRAAPRETGPDMVRRADVLAAIREASVHYEAGHESWLVSPHRLSETIQTLAALRPDAGEGTET